METLPRTSQQLPGSPKKHFQILQRQEKGFFRYYLEKADKPAAALVVTVTMVAALWAAATAIYNSRHDDQWLVLPPQKIGLIFQNQDTAKLKAPGQVEKQISR